MFRKPWRKPIITYKTLYESRLKRIPLITIPGQDYGLLRVIDSLDDSHKLQHIATLLRGQTGRSAFSESDAFMRTDQIGCEMDFFCAGG